MLSPVLFSRQYIQKYRYIDWPQQRIKRTGRSSSYIALQNSAITVIPNSTALDQNISRQSASADISIYVRIIEKNTGVCISWRGKSRSRLVTGPLVTSVQSHDYHRQVGLESTGGRLARGNTRQAALFSVKIVSLTGRVVATKSVKIYSEGDQHKHLPHSKTNVYIKERPVGRRIHP